ncbi:MAG: hypothetical protein K6C35_04230 [Eubacterium sp.]|nr:hypothetical protein [Eubacterium sp.]
MGIVVVGNGLLRTSIDCSCNEIIKKSKGKNNCIISDEICDKLTFPQRIVVASNDNVDEEVKRIAKEVEGYKNDDKLNSLIRELLLIPTETILTTNYSFEIEKCVYGDFSKCFHWSKRRWTKKIITPKEKQFNLYEYNFIEQE